MNNKLSTYNQKRDFKKTDEPIGKISKKQKRLRFVVQHHLARKDHYDFRLEWDGVLKSWAVPKGPSYNVNEKRLAVLVEDHPYDYRNFEGTIPYGQYGGGTVMLFDEGYWVPYKNFEAGFKKGIIKFELKGKRLKGNWSLIRYKDNNWLLIKEEDGIKEFKDISKIKTSIRTGRTMEEIRNGVNKKRNSKNIVESVEISNPDKILYANDKIKKIEVIKYYQMISDKMLPYIKNRIISVVRCPEGIDKEIFYKKHLEPNREGIEEKKLNNKSGKKDEYFYITSIEGLINEAQMNSIEIHTWGSDINDLNYPNIMVFDLDPDESLSLKKIREGVKDLKRVLNSLKLKSYLKTSGGKGYHIVVPINGVTWNKFRTIAKNIAEVMEQKWPNKYTSNVRKNSRKGKIFIDWMRNTKGATSIAPYSLRARKGASISFPIAWTDLDKIKPNEITLKNVKKYLKKKDPWRDFFNHLS